MAMVSSESSTSWMEKHPHIGAILHGSGWLFHYLFTGKWIVDLVRWLIETGGNVAESAFLLATVYVTINTVAHVLVTWLLPATLIVTFNQVSVIAFSVLPELIIFAAIKVTFDHFKMALSTRRFDAWAWALAYVLPTSVFLFLTILTISSFVSVEASSVNAPQATGPMLVTRCLAGWSYGMLQILFAKIGHEGYRNLFDRLRLEISALSDMLQARDASITDLQADLVLLKEQNAHQERELIDARIALATKKVTRHEQSDLAEQKSTSDEKSTAKNVTVAPTEKYQRLKEHLHSAVVRGEKVNLKKIAGAADVSYTMARRHAQSILDDLMRDRHTEKLKVGPLIEEVVSAS